MATQTGSIDLKAAKDAHDEASKKATNYLSADESGIMVYDGKNGTQTPSSPSANTNNVFIDSDSLDIRKGTEVLATFGADGATIGRNTDAHVSITEAGMQVYSLDNSSQTLIQLANIGYGETSSEQTSSTHPYYIMGLEDLGDNNITPWTNGASISSGQLYSYAGSSTMTKIYIAIDNTNASTVPPSEDTDLFHAIGWDLGSGRTTLRPGPYSYSEGYKTRAFGFASHVEGGSDAESDTRRTTAIGTFSHAEGRGTISIGYASHAEGWYPVATGRMSHAEGHRSHAKGECSHTEGYATRAIGYASHAEGISTTAIGDGGHAEGKYSSTGTAEASHAEGYGTVAVGRAAHSQNIGTHATYEAQTAIGKYNNCGTDTAFEIGNGTANNARSNAFTVDWQGNVVASGNITDGSGNVLSNKVNASSLATVATSGSYNDLSNKPSSTVTPTADTISKFDNSAHMNSTDMTAQEVQDFVDGLDAQGESLYELFELDTNAYGTLSVYNCTGTISHNQLDLLKTNGGEIIVQGRVNINSFERTGTNPGVYITLPSFIPTPTVTREFIVGFRAQSPREGAVFRIEAGSRTAFLKTTESYANAANGTLTFIVSGRIFIK